MADPRLVVDLSGNLMKQSKEIASLFSWSYRIVGFFSTQDSDSCNPGSIPGSSLYVNYL